MWFCSLYMMFGRLPNALGLMLFPVMITLLGLYRLLAKHPLAFVISLVFISLVWFAFLGVLIGVQIALRTIGKPPRVGRTVLTPEGVLDIFPDKTTVLPWNTIKEIRQHNGSVYFWTSNSGAGIWAPHNAFLNRADSQRFADAGVAALRGDFSLLQSPVAVSSGAMSSSDIWPPPPQSMPQSVTSSTAQDLDMDEIHEKAKRDKKKQQISIWRGVIITQLVIVSLPSRHPIDAAHAHSVLVYHISVYSICTIALIVLWILDRKK